MTIRYNILNLPETIQFGNGRQIINSYDAGGHKLTTQYYTPIGTVIVTQGNIHGSYTTANSVLLLDDYCGSYLYENGTSASVHPLTKILTPEGYIDMSTSGYPYCYYKQDHLGSNREVTSYAGTTGTVVQQTEYYPSGTAYVEGTGAGVQPFKFTGKELILMHGLNWQDYGARWLDNVRMQWTTMDPMAEKYYGVSPYAYVNNNLINKIDPIGLTDYDVQNSTGNISVAPDLQFIIENIIVKIYYTLPKSNPGESDTFFATNDKGERTGDSYTVKEGVQMRSFKGSRKSAENNSIVPFRADELIVPNNKEGKGLFEFMADHTNVEWSQFKLESGKNILSTSHMNGTELAAPSVWGQIDKMNDNIVEWNHSHPGIGDRIQDPSGYFNSYTNSSGDKGMLGRLMYDYSGVKANVYVPAYSIYYQYDLFGIKQATLKTKKKP